MGNRENTNPLIAKYGRGTSNIPANSPSPMPDVNDPNYNPLVHSHNFPETKPPENPLITKYLNAYKPSDEDKAISGTLDAASRIADIPRGIVQTPMAILAGKILGKDLIGNDIGNIATAKFPLADTYLQRAGVPELGRATIPNPSRESKITYPPEGGVSYGPDKTIDRSFDVTGRGAIGKLADILSGAGGAKLLGMMASGIGNWAQERPYSQLNEISRQKGGMKVNTLLKEEGINPNDYKEMTTAVGDLSNNQYPSAMQKIAEKVKSGGIQMEPPESAFEKLQSKLNEWKKSPTRSDAANLLQEDLDETIKKLNGGDFTNYGDVKTSIDKTLSPEQMGIIQSAKKSGLPSTYNKMKGEALRFARANAAEAAEPGLGQQVFDIGNKQQTLQAVGKKIAQKAVAESQAPTIGGIPRFLEKMILERPGPMTRIGSTISGVGDAAQSPWDFIMRNKTQGQ